MIVARQTPRFVRGQVGCGLELVEESATVLLSGDLYRFIVALRWLFRRSWSVYYKVSELIKWNVNYVAIQHATCECPLWLKAHFGLLLLLVGGGWVIELTLVAHTMDIGRHIVNGGGQLCGVFIIRGELSYWWLNSRWELDNNAIGGEGHNRCIVFGLMDMTTTTHDGWWQRGKWPIRSREFHSIWGDF